MIVKEEHYHQIYIYSLLHRWGFKQKVPRKVHVNTASYEEKEEAVDESFFFFDSLVKRVWIYKGSRPVVTITGSHRNLSMFGAISLSSL